MIAWQTRNDVSRRKSTAKAKLNSTSQEERIHLWKQHFENLLGNPPKFTHGLITRIISKQLDIKLGPFTQKELDSVLKKFENRKAAGLDEIPAKVWKTRQFDDLLLRHCNAVCNQNPIDRWVQGCKPLFRKKGDLGWAKNYRGIALKSIAAKIYNTQIRNCIESKIENILWKNQRRHKFWLSIRFLKMCVQKLKSNNIICRLNQSLWFHSQRKDGTNSTCLRPTKRNRRRHNDALLKQQSKSPFSIWRHRLLRLCSRCTVRRHISPIPAVVSQRWKIQ